MRITLTSRRRRAFAVGMFAAAIAVGLFLLAGWWPLDLDKGKESDRFSAFTRAELRTSWPGAADFPLVVPRSMPKGASTAPEVGFSLDDVLGENLGEGPSGTWRSQYESDVLGPSGASFTVFQRPLGQPVSEPCGPAAGALPRIERTVEDTSVVICSRQLADAEARDYWQSVPMTSDLDSVDWLRS